MLQMHTELSIFVVTGRISVFERVMGRSIHYPVGDECDMLFR
jgi:hypothetical protein